MARPDARPIDPERLVERLGVPSDAARIVRAPGRVNLIGEHTDYNDGLVLPVAIDLEIRIAFVPTDDSRVVLRSADDPEPAAFSLDATGPRRGSWIDYVAGTAWALDDAGISTRGISGVVGSTLPREAGLSSSAALELASAWALAGETLAQVDRLDLARICQRAENEYVGVRCGLMDQFAVAAGQLGAAMLLDCRTLEHRAVPLPSELTLVVCHSGAARRLGSSSYNARRADCERAVSNLSRARPGITALRDLAVEDLGWAATILDELAFRRCRHVVTENARVEATVDALAAGDEPALGSIFAAGHVSLRDDYEVSSPELDLLVEVAAGTPGVIATRMTGGGFGGCTVALVRPDAVGRLATEIALRYDAATGLRAQVIQVLATAGAGFLTPGQPQLIGAL